MTLQWTKLFEPYAQNFVQFRKVANLTASVSNNDLATHYTTLSMVFMSGGARQFTVPNSVLVPGAHYEFRLGFPFPSYTYYTNTLVAKVFDAESPFVSGVEVAATDVLSTVSWSPPEYSVGVVGYRVAIMYKTLGNGPISNPKWTAADNLQLVSSKDLSLTQTSIRLGCTDVSSPSCLVAFTTYLVQISVIRQSGVDSAKSVYFSTLHTQRSARNASSMHLYGGTIKLDLTVAVPRYRDASIASTFLHPLVLSNKRGDLALSQLTESTVNSISTTSVLIRLSEKEASVLLEQLHQSSFGYSTMFLAYGDSRASLMIQPSCLSDLVVV